MGLAHITRASSVCRGATNEPTSGLREDGPVNSFTGPSSYVVAY